MMERRSISAIMKIIYIHIALLCLLIGTGCQSSSYWTDRLRDSLDVFTAGQGNGIGTKARVGPLQTGLLFDIPNYALRGGEFVEEGPHGGGWTPSPFPEDMDVQLLIYGGEEFTRTELNRDKNYKTEPYSLFLPLMSFPFPRSKSPSYAYYSEFEIVLGIYYTIRLGFNPGEALDFLLGWTTIDIYGDDIGSKETKEKIEQ